MKVKRNVQNILTGYLLILPAVLIISLFVLFPIVRLFVMSFEKFNMLSGSNAGDFVGFSNYARILQDKDFKNAFLNTLFFALVVVPVQNIIALLIALLVNTNVRGRGVFRTVFYIPVIISFVVVSVFWGMIYDPMFGLANSVLKALKLPPQRFLSDPNQAMMCVIIVCIWKSWAWFMLIYLSGLQGIPSEIYEAASIDGAGKFKGFFYITLPLLRKTILFTLVITNIDALKIYTPVYVMTGGNPLGKTDVAVHRIWLQAFRFNDMGYASALSVVLFIVIFIATIIQFSIEKERE